MAIVGFVISQTGNKTDTRCGRTHLFGLASRVASRLVTAISFGASSDSTVSERTKESPLFFLTTVGNLEQEKLPLSLILRWLWLVMENENQEMSRGKP